MRPENIHDFPKMVIHYYSWIYPHCLIIGGFINAVIPVTREYNITINKSAGQVKNLRIAAVSDIHLGSIIRKRSIKKLSGILQKMKPDLVLLLGILLMER